ncbi:hypothetical protein AS850_13485 [Frondihabitans sp. 762G35]|uniref:hypothetical protein n=1 Tax=Frondihabitans sp. 762G35 TaxID=1446794 RepID=UPI000D212AC8|nr:hypothetical protein [Frondihabitans sp. 762G35]ARC58090.1 hypothetical protein AS850_13485 [Frondihabitans sp. 762G35]
MRPKFFIILLIAFIAYLLGAKAGTSRYKEITSAFSSVWNDPKVKKARKQAKKDVAKGRKLAAKQAKRRFS